MKIVSVHESYSSSRLRELLPVLLWLLGIFLLGLGLIAAPLFSSGLQKFYLPLLICGIFCFWVVKDLFDPLMDRIHEAWSGKEGEAVVAKILSETLDNNYTYVKNYLIPNTRIGDIDGLLIGPKGLILIEVKNYQGVFRIAGNDVLRRLRGDIYKLYRKSPFKQTERQQEYLAKYLKGKGIIIPIHAVIALVSGKISAISGETGLFIAEAQNLTNYVFKLKALPDWSPDSPNRLLSVLGLPPEYSLAIAVAK